MKNNGINIAEWSVALSNQKLFYMAIINAQTQLTFVNSHFFTSIQRNAAGKFTTFFDCIHTEDLDRFRTSLEKARIDDHPLVTEIRMKNDKCKWLKWQITGLETEGMAGGKFLCLGYDIAGEEQLKKYARITGHNYQRIIDDLNVGIIFQDIDGGIISANLKAAEILDTTLEELYNNKDILCLCKTPVRENGEISLVDAPPMKALLTGKNQTNVVVNMVTPGGADRSILWNSQVLCETDQCVPSSVMSSLVDMTKEKKLEMEAKTREALFTSFMDHTPFFSWIVNAEGTLLYANQPLLTYLQTDRQAIGMNISTILSPCLATPFLDMIDHVRMTEQADHNVVRSLMADGTEHVFQLTVFPIYGISPSISIGGEALDITEAFNAREEAKKVTERLFYISQASSEAIWDWDMSTGQIYCNQALQMLIGSSLNNVLDLDWCYQCIHEEDRARVEATIRRTLDQHQQSWEMEYRFLTVSGIFKTVYNRGFIIYEDKKALRMIGSFRDISDVRKLETQLVSQRLKQQKGIAEAIIQAQQEERARIGHELHDNVNQILTSANLYLSVLDPGSPEFGQIKTKAQEIVSLAIEEIRILSKDLVMPDFKEDGLIGSIGHLVDELRMTKLLHVEFSHNDKWSIELLDLNRKITLFRIVQEQTKNIIKYSCANSMEISVHCTENQVRLLVRDDGKGFDPKTTKRGLGLSNIYERTRLYGGKVILNSAPGEGCCLIVNLPLECMP